MKVCVTCEFCKFSEMVPENKAKDKRYKKMKYMPVNYWICSKCGENNFCGPGTVNKLPLNTRIYNGFGGWTILKNDELIYMGDYCLDFDQYPTLRKFELMARKDPDADWQAVLYLPLRGGTYQRHGHNTWVLIEENEGFA